MEPAAGMLQVKLEPGLVQFSLLEAIQCEAQLFFIYTELSLLVIQDLPYILFLCNGFGAGPGLAE